MNFFRLMSLMAAHAVAIALVWDTTGARAEGLGDYCGETIRVGVRNDAPPFSFRPSSLLVSPEKDSTVQSCGPATPNFPEHAGFTVALCDAFLVHLNESCAAHGAESVNVEVIPLTAAERVASLLGTSEKEIDLLCGATTATVWMSGRLPRSPHTFVTPSRAMLPARFGEGEDAQCRIGVVGGTTSSQRRADKTMLPGWDRFVSSNSFCGTVGDAPLVAHEYADYPEALANLLSGPDEAKSDLLIADHHILRWYQENLSSLKINEAGQLSAPQVDQRSFTLEPYAIFGGHDDQPLVAQLSLYLAEQQRDGSFEARVTDCFGRRIDESLLRLLEIQKRTPLGDPDAE
ncbi:substrate-binding periplasmic protein [Roseobacter sp. A03A-229]